MEYGVIMKLLGYELIHIDGDYYDATELFSEVELPNILVACETEGFDIIAIDKEKAIVAKLHDE